MNPIILIPALLLISFSTTTANPTLGAFSIRDFFSDDLNGTTTSTTTTTTAASYPVDEVNPVDVKDEKKPSSNGTRRVNFSIPEFIIPLPDDPRIRRPVEAFLGLLIPALNHSIIAAQEIVRNLPRTVSVRVSQDSVSAIKPIEKRKERALEIDEVISTTESTGEGRDHLSSDSIDELSTKDTAVNGLPILPITFLQADQLDGDATNVHKVKVTTEEPVSRNEVSHSRHERSAPVGGRMMASPGYPPHSPYGLGYPFNPMYNPLGIGFMG